MKLSDYVADFLARKKVDTVFVLTGGCILHCIDSIAAHPKIKYIPVQNEQAGAMAADGYARVSGQIGVAMVTSGPGATNLLTGVCCSYYDSIPVMLITGQVPANQLKGDSRSRQIGFQETDVVSIFKPITKYAVIVDDPLKIRYELEKAYFLALEGRPGPVLLDICDDVQRAEIDPKLLAEFSPPKREKKKIHDAVQIMIGLIRKSKRPVFIVGGAVRLADISSKVENFLARTKMPYTLTWGAADCLEHDSPYYVGGFGVTSGRPGNFAVQNADLLIAFGTRLDTHEIGTNSKTFGRAAKKVVIDIDPSELEKYKKIGMEIDLLINEDVRVVIDDLLEDTSLECAYPKSWLDWIAKWKNSFPICLPEYKTQESLVNPYIFMESLSRVCNKTSIIVTDCGSNLIWTMQGFFPKKGQRIISAFNHSPMGYSLPAVMGTFFASPNSPQICLIGDGGAQVNIQELATIRKYNIDVKIFILNNHGHGIIQGTQDNWLKSRYHASNPDEGGLPDPDFKKIAEAYDITAVEIFEQENLDGQIEAVLSLKGPVVCVVHMMSGAQISPKLLYGRPIEDSDPLLSRDELEKNMIIPPLNK